MQILLRPSSVFNLRTNFEVVFDILQVLSDQKHKKHKFLFTKKLLLLESLLFNFANPSGLLVFVLEIPNNFHQFLEPSSKSPQFISFLTAMR